MTGQITWSEDERGNGVLTLVFDDGIEETVEWEEPITSSTDSHNIANQFLVDFYAVDHDKDTVFVQMN